MAAENNRIKNFHIRGYSLRIVCLISSQAAVPFSVKVNVPSAAPPMTSPPRASPPTNVVNLSRHTHFVDNLIH